MKKKLFFAITILCLAAVVACLLVACGKDKGGDDATFDYDATAVSGQLEALRSGNGYLIRYETSGSGLDGDYTKISVGAKGNIYYLADDQGQYYYDLTDDTAFAYYEKIGNGAWTKEITHYSAYYPKATAEQAMNAYVAAHSVWLTYYQNFVASMSDMQKGTDNVAGRDCDKYTFSAAALTGEGLNTVRATYSCYIDKATSICLKWECSATVDGKTESYVLTCTEFNANPTFTLPTVTAANTTIDGERGQGESGTGTGDNGNTNPSGGNGESGQGEGGNGQGGQGEGGNETGEVVVASSFCGKTLRVTAINPANDATRAQFGTAYASMLGDGSFEIVTDATVLFGTFTTNQAGTTATLVTQKAYDVEDAEYYYDFPRECAGFTMRLSGGTYTMLVVTEDGTQVTLTLAVADERPMRADLPTDPNGDEFDPAYQVTQATWESVFIDKAMMDNGNFTVAYSIVPNGAAVPSSSGTFKVDGNKYCVAYENGAAYYQQTGTTTDEYGQYAYNYIVKEGNSWYTSPASINHEWFDNYTGTIDTPFLDNARFAPYSHYYAIDSYRYTQQGTSFTRNIYNFKAWFENGKLKKLQYDADGERFTFDFSAYGTTTVTLPTGGNGGNGEGGNGNAENIYDYYELLEGKVLGFEKVSGISGEEATAATAAYADATFTVFEDDAVEIYFAKSYFNGEWENITTVLYGTLTFSHFGTGNSTGKRYVSGSVPLTTGVVNGTTVYTDDLGSLGIMWYIGDEQLRLDMDDHFVWFSISDGIPAHIAIPETGNGEGEGEGGEGGEVGEVGLTYRILDDYPDLAAPAILMESLLCDGVSVSYVDDGTTYTYAAKGTVYYIANAYDETYYDLSDEDTIDVYTYDGENWEKTTKTYEEDGYESREAAIEGYAYGLQAFLFDAGVQLSYGVFGADAIAKVDTTFLGYEAVRYTFDEGEGVTVNVTLESKMGIILAWTCSYNGTPVGEYAISALNMEADVVLP